MIVFYPKKYTLKCTFSSCHIWAKKLSIKVRNRFSCIYEKYRDFYGYYSNAENSGVFSPILQEIRFTEKTSQSLLVRPTF